MTIVQAVFLLFAFLVTFSAVMVVIAKNPVHAVLFLILAFFNAAALFLIAGAEFLAMLLVVVYVGAVAVLFMFVVMMLDINFASLKESFRQNAVIGMLIGVALALELFLIARSWSDISASATETSLPDVSGVSNTEALGNVLYTDHILIFQMAGLILLVAIIGAISLTLREREGVKRQSVFDQMHSDRRKSVTLRKVSQRRGA